MKNPFSGPNKLYRIFLVLGLMVFVGLLAQFLSTPYFWDEMGVYTQAALRQYAHHLSLMPASIDPEYSRGHPLFSAMVFGAAYKLLGPTQLAAHLMALLLAIGVAITTYRIAEKYYNGLVGVLSVALLLVQPLFVAQSLLVLPEMLLTLTALIAIKAFMDDTKLLYFVMASLALLTKEAAIVLPFVVLGSSFVYQILQGNNPFRQWKNWLVYLSPLLVFGGFLLIQKAQNGWYFFPLHTKLMSWDFDVVFKKLSDFYRFMFFLQQRSIITVVALIGLGWFVIKQVLAKRMMVRSISLPVVTSLMFILALLIFSSVNFYMNRYLLAIFPVYCLLAAIALASLPLPVWIKGITAAVAMYLCITAIYPKEFDYDNNLGYQHLVQAQKDMTKYLEADPHFRAVKIHCSFMVIIGLKRAENGYISGPPFDNVEVAADDADYICLLDHDTNEVEDFPLHHGFEPFKTFGTGDQKVRMFKVLRAAAQ